MGNRDTNLPTRRVDKKATTPNQTLPTKVGGFTLEMVRQVKIVSIKFPLRGRHKLSLME